MELVKYFFRRSWAVLALATVSGLVSGVSSAALAIVVGRALTGEREAATAWTFFALCLLSLLSKMCTEFSLLRLTQAAILHLRIDLSRKLLHTPWKKLQAIGKAELQGILNHDIGVFTDMFQLIPHAFCNVIIVVVCFGYMAWLSLQMFAVFSIFFLTASLLYHFLERIPLRYIDKLRSQMDVLRKHFRDLVEGSRELQMNAKRGRIFVEQSIATDSLRLRDMFIRTVAGYSWIANIGAVMFYVAIGAAVFLIPRWLPQSSAVITAFTVILLYIIGPVSQILGVLRPLRQAGASLKKIGQLGESLDEIRQIRDSEGADPFSKGGSLRLDLQGICHRYQTDGEESQFVLGPLDLTVDQNEILFVVGGNGSGKSTLAMLLLGIYEPEKGSISLNGVRVDKTNIDSYRQNFSVVFSDFHLFEQLVGAESVDVAARAAYYIEKFGMSHKVKIDGDRFTAKELSSGQRKRLALVSSYLEDRAVYVFDEWAADQDPTFKRVFYTEILPDLKANGKAVIVITHDDAYFSCADRVVKLENGRLQTEKARVWDGTSSLLRSI